MIYKIGIQKQWLHSKFNTAFEHCLTIIFSQATEKSFSFKVWLTLNKIQLQPSAISLDLYKATPC